MAVQEDKPDPLQGSRREWPETGYTREIREILGEEVCPEQACCIVYLGGCTIEGGTLGGARVGSSGELARETQFHLAARLRRAFPGQPVVIRNFAEAGVTAGEFLEEGNVERMCEDLARIDVAFLRFGITDRKYEGIPRTIENIRALCRRLQIVFEGITVVLETDMWVDNPEHYLWDRNSRLEPLYAQLRQLAANEGYPLVDIYANVAAETRRGNWDLRRRAIPIEGYRWISDDSFDEFFAYDRAYFTNIHPNNRCLGLIADWEVAKLKELFGDALPGARRATQQGAAADG
ncbi:MAG: SGNH/GDSL hydrolase family protein [Planctomycetota bacterium]|jgi:hypothetical protein